MPILPDGEYLIRNIEADLYMDLSGGSAQPFTPINGWQATKSPNQKWQITTTNGFNEFTIQSSVGGSAFLGLSPIRIYPPMIAVEQVPVRWSIEPVGDGVFRLAFPYNDGAIAVPDGGRQGQLYLPPWEGMRTQKWAFEPA